MALLTPSQKILLSGVTDRWTPSAGNLAPTHRLVAPLVTRGLIEVEWRRPEDGVGWSRWYWRRKK